MFCQSAQTRTGLKVRSTLSTLIHLGIWTVAWVGLFRLDCAIASPQPSSQPSVSSSFSPSLIHPSGEEPRVVATGRFNYQNGQFVAAITDWKQALTQFEYQGDRLNQAMVWSNLAIAYQQLGQWDQANQAIATSLEYIQSLETNPAVAQVQAQIFNNQGSLQLAQGQAEAALSSWQAATTLYQQAGDQDSATWSLLNQAQALRTLGFYQRANQVLEQVKQSLQTQPNSALKVASLLHLGNALQTTGNEKQARVLLEQSLKLAQTLQPTPDTTGILVSLGNLARLQQQPQVALNYYQQALNQSSTLSNRFRIQVNQLRLLLETEQWAQAESLGQSLQQQVPELPASRNNIYTQIHLAQGLLKLQPRSQTITLSKIAPILSQAVQQSRALADPRAESYAIGTLAHLYEVNQQWSESRELTEKALLLAQLSHAPDIAYRWQWQLGRLLKAQGDRNPESQKFYTQAITAYSEAISTLKTLRSDLVAVNSEVQFSFRESVEPVYRQLVSLLLQSEGKQTSQKNLKQAREVIESLQVAELDNFFQEACLTQRSTTADQVDPKTAVVYPIILPDRLEVILSLPNQPLQHYATAITQPELEKMLAKMRRSLRRTSLEKERLAISRQIYSLLIQPFETELKTSGVNTLAFVLDGSFRNVPVAALHDGQQYLIEKYSLALTPSLQLIEPKRLVQQQVAVLMGGLSEARHGFQALPGVETELKQIQSELPTQVLFNQGFTTTAFQKQVAALPFPVVHLATHGQFSSDAEKTFVLVWDQPLNVKQLGELLRDRSQQGQAPIELLVLSACQTAEGDNRAALGLAGVAVRSGARSTLATLWPVDDQSTSTLMTEFYQQISQGGITKAEALRQAQLSLLKQSDFRHPYYWAPFLLVGNWL